MPSSDEADSKAIFFDELYALSQISDDERDTDGFQQLIANQVTQNLEYTPGEGHDATPASDNLKNIHSVRRTASQPILTSHDTSLVLAGDSKSHFQGKMLDTLDTASLAKEPSPSSINQKLHQRRAPNRTVSTPTPSTTILNGKMDKSSLGKRKRKDGPLKHVPQTQQIFLGYNFFFIPNDDVAPMRRARIRKALEHGATWNSEWSDEITHIIVDKPLSYEQVISFLKLPSIPASMIMVNDIYTIECIQFRAILDPVQTQYRVKGHEKILEKQPEYKFSSQTSDISLQLKPKQSRPGKWDFIPRQETPPRSEASTQIFPSMEHLEPQPSDALANTGIETHQIDRTKNAPEEGCRATEVHPPMAVNGLSDLEGGDVLNEMIEEARKMTYLPLDEDDSNRPISSDGDSENETLADENNCGSDSKLRASSGKELNDQAFNQENFSCMRGGNGMTDTTNPNSRTIPIIQEMADYYARTGDAWRPIAYRRAISVLRQQSTKITTSNEAKALPGIGQRLALKIEEIVATDRLRRLENMKGEPSDLILQKFMGIYGVGFSQANKWLHSGFSTLEDLQERASLTENQLLGIEHYDDFQTRIPRDEVTALGDIIKATARAIDPKVEIIISGSYRRGADTSRDIDCLITKANTSNSSDIFVVLTELISRLTSRNFLVAALAIPRSKTGTKWHGCCVLPGAVKAVWRRIDFLLVPASELGAALIYFTGNDIFNRSIRLLASRKGMRLNQRGLYKDVMRGPGRAKLNEGELVEGADENKIFATLGVPWRPPEQRIC